MGETRGFRSSLAPARLTGTELVTHRIPVSKRAKLSLFPVFPLARHGNDPNHSPIAFRRWRLSPDGSPNDTNYLLKVGEYLVFPDPHHDPPRGFEFASKPAVALGV